MDRRQAIAAAAGAAVWACDTSPRPANGKTHLTVALYPFLSMAGFYTAHEFGYFEDLDLDIEIVSNRNVAQVAPLLAAGRLDVALTALAPALITAVLRGANIRVVAGRETASTTCGSAGAIYGNRKVFPNGRVDLRQLVGKRVAVQQRASLSEFYLDVMLATVELSTSDCEIVYLAYPEASAAIVSGRVDAIVYSQFEKDLAAASETVVRGPSLADVFPNMQYAQIFFGPTLLEGDPDVGARFLAGYLRGANEFLNGRTPVFLEEYAKSHNMDPERAKNSCRNTFTPDGSIVPEDVDRFVEWCVQRGYVEAAPARDQLIDTTFIERAQEIHAGFSS